MLKAGLFLSSASSAQQGVSSPHTRVALLTLFLLSLIGAGSAQDTRPRVNAATPTANHLRTGSPGGSNGQVQFNDLGVFGGDPAMMWDSANKVLQVFSGDPFGPAGVEVTGGGVAGKL